MKARHYLILMAVAILVPVTVIAGAGLSMLLDWERESRIRSVESNARATALLVDREIAAAQAALRALGHSDTMRRGDFAEIHREAGAMNAATPWTWTLMIDYDGSPLLNTLVPYGTRLPGHAGPWVAQAWDSQRPRVSGYFVGALSRKPTVSVDVPPLRVDGDATRLEQVFDNLLHNAIKYTPAGGAIAVHGRVDDGMAVFEVSDTGVGIEPATLPLIFEALVQGPVSIDRAQGGPGLRLALVRELAALHGGSATAASGGEGQGSTFTLRLPLIAAPARSADPEPDAAASAA